ncbi:cytochrome P450 [Syncephalis plumigaleata]|nr:cytochrome P450 [Syncephalis plumigaleata]
MAILSTLAAPLLDIILDWRMVGVTLGAWLLGQIVYDEFLSPVAKIPGMRAYTLDSYIMLYKVITGQMQQYISAQTKKYGGVVRVRSKVVTTDDPDALRMMWNSPKSVKSDMYDTFHFHGPNIFSTRDIEFHRKLKRIISPVFSVSSVAELEPLISEAGIERLSGRVNTYAETGKTFDILELLYYTTLDVISAVSFGGSFNTLVERPGEKPHPIIHWINDIGVLGFLKGKFGFMCNRWTLPRHFRSEKEIVEFTRNAILKRITDAAKDKDNGMLDNGTRDVLLRLIESEDPETGEKLNIDQLISESIIQLIGGTDTTSLTTTWTLHLLHDNPNTCQKLFEELKQAIPDRAQSVHHNDVKNLPYLNAVLYESMRMRPVAGGSIRESPPGGMTIKGHFIPEGYSVLPALLAIHNSAEVFGDDVETFRPERWIEASEEQLRRMKQCFFTFSMGSRACIGQNLAWMELRLLLSTLVRRFEFTVPPGEEVDMTPTFLFVIKPKDDAYRVRATLRSD